MATFELLIWEGYYYWGSRLFIW